MGKLGFGEVKGLPQGQPSRKWQTLSQADVASNPGVCYVCGLGQVPNPSESRCPHLSNGDNSPPIVGLLRGLGVICSEAQSSLKTGIFIC